MIAASGPRRDWRRAMAIILPMLIAPPAAAQTVATYHGHANRSGNFVMPGLTWERARTVRLDPGFAPRFAGHLYAQPLYWRPPGGTAGELIVATESNVVAAIDAADGRTLWQRALGPPARLAQFPCGNIDPLGITGTPVIDPAGATLYLDAMVARPRGPRHELFALSLADGSLRPGWPIDIADALRAIGLDFNPRLQNQRAALALLDGNVYVGYGGFFGDCGNYRGWVVGVNARDPRRIMAWRSRARGGAVWAPGGIAGDGGSLYFDTGNTIGARRWADGEAVFRMPPDLRSSGPGSFFAPADWRALDARDLDLIGTNPLPFTVASGGGAQHLILVIGKSGEAYVLDPADLGGIGGQLEEQRVARFVITAPAWFPAGNAAMIAFQERGAECPRGERGDLAVLRVTAGRPPGLATAWCGAISGRGSPIVTTTDGRSNPIVWMLGAEGDGRLHAFRGDDGAPLYVSAPLAGLRHFGTLIAADGRLYVGADGRLYAFAPAP